MALIDELKIFIKAGDGGDGVVRWQREKFREFGGPSGGNGGRGGDVYALCVRDIHLLSRHKHKKEFAAEDGENGMEDSKHGADGEDLYIELPIGSVITNNDTGERFSLDREDQKTLLLKGGSGGRGNETFKSSTNTSPEEWTPGQKGQKGGFFIELELVADAGLIGFPNAGKSSLLNALTAAKAKTADYPFTTLEPNLGELHGYILADIPGLIEGASVGKGLGHKFLRHIKRTKILLHLISLEREDVAEAYSIIRKELEDYDTSLGRKKEIIILTKTDLVSEDAVDRARKALEDKGEVYAISVYDDQSLKSFADELTKILRESAA